MASYWIAVTYRATAQHSKAVEVMKWEMTFHEFELVNSGSVLVALFDLLSNASLEKDPCIDLQHSTAVNAEK